MVLVEKRRETRSTALLGEHCQGHARNAAVRTGIVIDLLANLQPDAYEGQHRYFLYFAQAFVDILPLVKIHVECAQGVWCDRVLSDECVEVSRGRPDVRCERT